MLGRRASKLHPPHRHRARLPRPRAGLTSLARGNRCSRDTGERDAVVILIGAVETEKTDAVENTDSSL
eukprot:COSAG02_NODE_1789_length_10924_cov_4.791224_4_plen_68_part_00